MSNETEKISDNKNSETEKAAATPDVASETPAVNTDQVAAVEASATATTADSNQAGESASRVRIGSQRDAAQKSPAKPQAVQAAIANPIQLAGAEQEVPAAEPAKINSMAGLGEDVDAEIEAMMNDVSMDDIVAKVEAVENELEPNARVKGTVNRVHGEHVFFKLPGQFEGIASLSSFNTPPEPGAMLDVIVRGLNKEDRLYEISIPGSSVDVAELEEINEGDVIEARVSGSNTGGLEVMINRIRGFIPASQIDRFRVENFGDYVGKKLQCIVMEVNPAKKKLVLSRRAVLDRENEAKRKELLETIEAGQLMEGTVTKLMDFGAFVDLGGIEGLVHISKLSWNRVKHPQEVVEVGQKVKVKIESIDKESGKLSLSHRDTIEHPWESISNKLQVNEIVKGTVTKIMDFGAFVKVAAGIEGLVHISEIAHHRVVRVQNYVAEGQEVECKVLSIDTEKQKIGLSIKATQSAPVKPDKDNKQPKESDDAPARPLIVEKRDDGPLKGGTNRKSGGEDIGLNW